MDNIEKQIILLARISTLKDMQIYCVKEEEKLREELSKLGYNQFERKKYGNNILQKEKN